MNILFLGNVCPKDRESEIRKLSSYFDQPANVLQWALLSGFDEYATIKVVTSLSIKSAHPVINGSHFSHKQGSDDICIDMYSNTFRRKLTSGRNMYDAVMQTGFVPDCTFVYSYTFELMSCVYKLKRKYPDTKVVVMITDLAEYMNANLGLLKYLKKVETAFCEKVMKSSVDGFVLLSEYMKERIPIGNKKYCVVEGIFQRDFIQQDVIKESSKVFLYTGNLGKRYGVLDMVYAFEQVDGEEYQLWICGNGDSVDEIKDIAKNDTRIKYLGVLDRNTILNLQKQATVLINPRHRTEVFTKYSFPSKTMEYMASGTPTLMSKLDSLPPEYYAHLYFFEDESIEGMSKTMKMIADKPREELNDFGRRASNFILETRNQYAQCKKITDFIENL